MRDPKRIDRILAKIEKIWKQYPDLRLGQLIHSVAYKAVDGPSILHQLEDDVMEDGIDKYMEELEDVDPPLIVDVDFDSVPHRKHPHVYLVWGYFDSERADLRAIATYKERAEHYKKVLLHEATYRKKAYDHVVVEKNRLNHLYGFGMIQALYDIEIEPELQEMLDKEQEEMEGMRYPDE